MLQGQVHGTLQALCASIDLLLGQPLQGLVHILQEQGDTLDPLNLADLKNQGAVFATR